MNKLLKKSILLGVLTIVLVVLADDLYARAGGGGGGGASSGSGASRGGFLWKLVVLIIWAVYTVVVSFILFFKSTRSNRIIGWAFKQDGIWDANKMREHAKSIFFKMQNAWMERDMNDVKDFVSTDLYEDYKQQLSDMRKQKRKNILEAITVLDVKIISSEDFNDNSKDSFIAYIKGSMIDYSKDEMTGNVVENTEKKEATFKDNYHFIRSGNKWLLNYIDNDVTIGDLLSAKNYKEK